MDIEHLLSDAFEEFKSMLTGYFVSNKVKIHDVEDLVNDTFTLAWKYRNTLKDKDKVKSWIFSIAKNVLVGYKREFARRRRKEITLDEYNEDMVEAPMVEDDPYDEDVNLVLDLVNKLPSKYKDVFILFYVDQKSISEISEILGISEENCKVRLFRARKRMMDILGKENEA
jgi:RNA polymerase sigma-70 factor (ECF subfamily)